MGKMPHGVYPDKREGGYVLIQYTGIGRNTSTKRVWPPAKTGRKPMLWATSQEARAWAAKWWADNNYSYPADYYIKR